ncbi:MAG: CHAP domain-containing protein [Cyanobacteriota bacterium]
MLFKHLSSAIAATTKKNPLFVALITTLLVVILPVILALAPSASVAQSAKWCQCTNYVANRFGLRGYPNAGDWDNGYLARNGFHQINSPQNGAIVVLNPGVAGADRTYGHVGVVDQYTTAGNSLKINIGGTNQPGAKVANEYGCNNVTIWSNATNVINQLGVTYWVRNQPIDNQIYQLELRATPPSGIKQCFDVDGTKIGILPSANMAKVLPCRSISEQRFTAIYDGNDYYRFELQATPPSGIKQCFDVDGTKIGILPDADQVKVSSCRPIQEQQFKLIQDDNNYLRFELRATPPSGVKQCVDIDGTKTEINPNANVGKVLPCRTIHEQQFKLIRQ